MESAGFGAEFAELSVVEIEHEHGVDGFRDFLTVGSDILYRGSAHAAGNAAEALDSGTISGHGAGHESVPLFAGADVEQRLAIVITIALVNT